MVPELGIEPRWAQGPGDFESPASTSFTTPAQLKIIFFAFKKSRGKKNIANQ